MNQQIAKDIRRTLKNMGIDPMTNKPMYKRMKKLYKEGKK